MRQLSLAVAVGLVLGAAAWVLARRTPVDAPVSTPSSRVVPTEAVEETAARHPIFVSPAQPGLLIDVVAGHEPAPETRVELLQDRFEPTRSRRSWVPVGAETTDREGRAPFAVAAGHYLAVATGPAGRAQLEFDVGRATMPTVVTLALTPSRLLGGVVSREGSNEPIANAKVRIDLGGRVSVTVAQAATDSFGRFTASVPLSDKYFIRASAPGFVDAAESTPPTTQASIKLERGAVVSGRVTGAGQPLAGATVRVAPDATSTTTDADGRFELTVLAGPHSIHAMALDGRQALTRFTVPLGAERHQVDLEVAPGEALVGVVRAGERPAADADVRVLAEPDDLEVASFFTSADGRFEAKGLPRGRYLVRAQRGAGSRATAVGLELPHAPIELQLTGAATLEGTVFDADAAPVMGATVRVRWNLGMNEIPRSARTDSQGHFEFEDLLPAEVSVTATMGERVSPEVALYVGPDTTGKVELHLAARAKVVGRIEPGSPLVEVMFRSANETVRVKVEGPRFERELAPGPWQVLVRADGSFIEREPVVLRPGEVLELALQAGGDGVSMPDMDTMVYPEVGSGLSFGTVNGAVKIDFLPSDCPGAAAGLKQGDLVLSINGAPVTDSSEAFRLVQRPRGTEVPVVVRRDGRDQTLTLK